MSLTDAGSHVLALTERIESALLDCEQSLDMIAGRTGGRVSIGAVSTAKYFVPFAIAAFSQRFPKVDVSLRIGNREEIRAALRSYDLDIAVMGRPPSDIGVEMKLLGRHPHIIVASPDHRLARRKPVAPSDLADETFITRERGSGTRMLMEQFFQKNGLAPKISMEMDSNETIKQAVMAGLGVAFISGHTVASELQDKRLAVLPVRGLPLMRRWFVVQRADKALLPPARVLMDFIAEEAERFLPDLSAMTRVSAQKNEA